MIHTDAANTPAAVPRIRCAESPSALHGDEPITIRVVSGAKIPNDPGEIQIPTAQEIVTATAIRSTCQGELKPTGRCCNTSVSRRSGRTS